MQPKGEDTNDAVVSWYKEEIKTTTKQCVDLGKYFFATSTGAIALFTTLSEVAENSWGGIEWLSIILFMLSAAIGLFIMIPRLHKPGFDMVVALQGRALWAWRLSIAWLVVWALGVILAGVALFIDETTAPAPQGILGAFQSVGQSLGGLF